jgi:hypothetical protein
MALELGHLPACLLICLWPLIRPFIGLLVCLWAILALKHDHFTDFRSKTAIFERLKILGFLKSAFKKHFSV